MKNYFIDDSILGESFHGKFKKLNGLKLFH